MRLIALRPVFPALFFITVFGTAAAFATQTLDNPSPVKAKVSTAPSAILQPALGTLRQTLDMLRPDKWKTSSAVREETNVNIGSIRHDLDTSLPPLLADADAPPGSVVRMLPVFRNVGALYDVLLRVAAVARMSAPGPQSEALEKAMMSLEDARRTLGDALADAALAQEKQVSDLQTALRAIPANPPPAPVTAPAPAPDKKRKARAKSGQKAASVPAPSQHSAPASP